MSSPNRFVYALARVTIELRSPLAIGTGRGSDLIDAICVTDANGLPAIPGSSLAGVLRSALGDPGEAGHLFGFQRGAEGATSRVEVSWAHTHDAQDHPVAAAPRASAPGTDPVLAILLAGVVRDHVRINELGAVDQGGKFDRGLVPKGARFTFELLVHGSSRAEAERDLGKLLGVLASGALRLGARTRSGMGEFALVSALTASFDLSSPPDREAWVALPRALNAPPAGLKRWSPPAASSGRHLELQLVARDLWMFGTGRAVREEHRVADREGKAHDKVPVTERAITWTGGHGTVLSDAQGEVIVPASGIKGALRHRALFHARRREGAWAGEGIGAGGAEQAIDLLFGAEPLDGNRPAKRGRLILSDVRLTPQQAPSKPVQHVSLDRFTQGPMDGRLFSEAPVSGGGFTLRLSLDGASPDELGTEALLDALEDLVHGRLPLGAGASRGHGYFFGAPPPSRDTLRSSLGLTP